MLGISASLAIVSGNMLIPVCPVYCKAQAVFDLLRHLLYVGILAFLRRLVVVRRGEKTTVGAEFLRAFGQLTVSAVLFDPVLRFTGTAPFTNFTVILSPGHVLGREGCSSPVVPTALSLLFRFQAGNL